MASEISLEKIHDFLVFNNGKITNRDLVKHFKKHLIQPETKDEARRQFKAFVNMLATTKIENNEKYIVLRKQFYCEPTIDHKIQKNESLSILEENIPDDDSLQDQLSVSVKERTQKFNRLASQTDITSLNQRRLSEKGADEDDSITVTSLDSKLIREWLVKSAQGDYQPLAKLASDHPSIVKHKDPFTSYNALHWAAKHGNADLVKLLAGKYHINPNSRTNGGYTPLHIAIQFGHTNVYQLLVTVYGADPEIRDYSGRKATHYTSDMKTTSIKKKAPKTKYQKKNSDKESFLRIGSLNVKVKKTTEAFSNLILGHNSINSSTSSLVDSNEKSR